jgi:hypothetical protein
VVAASKRRRPEPLAASPSPRLLTARRPRPEIKGGSQGLREREEPSLAAAASSPAGRGGGLGGVQQDAPLARVLGSS